MADPVDPGTIESSHDDWYQQLMARFDVLEHSRQRSGRPWWAPDAQGFLAAAIVAICGVALFVRMFHASSVDDKMLDTMITILFSTCLVTVYQFTFGSSRGSAAKDEVQTKLVDKLVPVVPAPTTSTTTTSNAPITTTTTANP